MILGLVLDKISVISFLSINLLKFKFKLYLHYGILNQWLVEHINNHSGIYSRNRNFCGFGFLDGVEIQLKSSG